MYRNLSKRGLALLSKTLTTDTSDIIDEQRNKLGSIDPDDREGIGGNFCGELDGEVVREEEDDGDDDNDGDTCIEGGGGGGGRGGNVEKSVGKINSELVP